MAELPTYKGRFGHPEAERLLWRAGFGPRRGQAASLANLGLNGAVRSLTHPPGRRISRAIIPGRVTFSGDWSGPLGADRLGLVN